jgi:uncharacterized protein DUF664
MAEGGSTDDQQVDANKTALASSLDKQRSHVLGILDGLGDPQLRAPMLPSGWSCLGLVNHLALDVERYWFSCIIGGEPLDPADATDATSNWQVGSSDSAADVFARYRREIEASNAVIAAVALDAPPRQRDDWWGEWHVPDHRFVLLHVIAETACHAGHLDAARELIDGRQWVTL